MADGRYRSRALGSFALLCFTSLFAQDPAATKNACPPDQGETSSSQPCNANLTPAPPSKQSTAQQFPYPGESKQPEANAQLKEPGANTPDRPAKQPSAPSDTAGKFPYPGEDKSEADSSSSSSSSGNQPPLNDAGSEGGAGSASTRRKLPRPERIQSDEDRAAEDLSVAKFYQQSGNMQAAYLRGKDAMKFQPDDPEAHFAVAEIAEKLKKRDEALIEFTAYLKLDPDGEHKKAAQSALARLK